MIRRLIEIDEGRCDGCGLCASSCHEGAIEVIEGKARLVRDDFCDGLGDCLPACPKGAISFVEREAAAYSEAAVEENRRQKRSYGVGPTTPQSDRCPGSAPKGIERGGADILGNDAENACAPASSELSNWPVQIKLAPTQASCFDGAHLLIAADCCAYAFGAFHDNFIRERTCIIGCPKLDGVDYAEKLGAIIAENDVRDVTVCRMEVPCCGGLERMAALALRQSGKSVPWQVVNFSIDGRILS